MLRVSGWLPACRDKAATRVKLTPFPSSDRAQLMVTASARVLKRFYFLQRELIQLQAGWLPGIAHWETKLLLPEIMWESAQTARALRQRVLELRYPERRVSPEDEADLLAWFRRFGDAPSPSAFVLALAEHITPYLRRLYRKYRTLLDSLDDGPTDFLLRHALDDLDGQVARLQRVATDALDAAPAEATQARAWSAAVGAALRRLPVAKLLTPDSPPPPRSPELDSLARPFRIARTGTRDPRFARLSFAWPDRHTPGFPGEGRQLRARQAVHHVNEVWAAEMAAACLYDFSPEAPAEFLEDAARWCYDEIRHCRMGYERLKSWGFADGEIPLDSFSYDIGEVLPPIVRLGVIFYFEATYIHTKKERTVIFGEIGDRLSSHDMDFDWADELIHTHYGKKWLEVFLTRCTPAPTLASIKEEARQAVAQRLALVTPEEKSATALAFERVMTRMTTVP